MRPERFDKNEFDVMDKHHSSHFVCHLLLNVCSSMRIYCFKHHQVTFFSNINDCNIKKALVRKLQRINRQLHADFNCFFLIALAHRLYMDCMAESHSSH